MIIFSLVLFALMWWSWLIILFDGLLFLILILTVILIRLVALLVIFLTIVSNTGCLLAILLWQSTTDVIIIIDNHLFACILVDSRSMVSDLLLPLSSFSYVTALNLRNVVSEANFHMTLHRLSVWLLGVNMIR